MTLIWIAKRSKNLVYEPKQEIIMLEQSNDDSQFYPAAHLMPSSKSRSIRTQDRALQGSMLAFTNGERSSGEEGHNKQNL